MNPLLEKLLDEDIFKPFTREELIEIKLKNCTRWD